MIRKIDRAIRGPSWVEVMVGAVLAAILGMVLGAVLLVARPVVNVKALPKEEERDAKAVYYIEGTRDVTKGRETPAKRAALVQGQSVTVYEDHLNALFAGGMTPKAPAPKPADKARPGDKPAAGDDEMLVWGTPNFRLSDNRLQMAVPVTINVLGLSRQVVAQTRGGFVKRDSGFVFEPAEIYVGSCPVNRLPYVAGQVREKILSLPVPDDIKAAWSKLANVSIEGRALKLTMP